MCGWLLLFHTQRSLEQRAVFPGVPAGGRISRSARGAGLCSGLLFYNVPTLLNTLYAGHGLTPYPYCSFYLQVTIKAPNSEDSSYVNKKGFHSVGCQLVCNARGLLLSAETHWPGGLKDTDVLQRSALHKQLQDTEEGWLLGETWISHHSESEKDHNRNKVGFIFCFLGDCRYPLRKWLMTPVDNPESPAEFRYNLAHTATHEIVDRTFRAIQTRFRCLDGTKGYLQVICSTPFLLLWTVSPNSPSTWSAVLRIADRLGS